MIAADDEVREIHQAFHHGQGRCDGPQAGKRLGEDQIGLGQDVVHEPEGQSDSFTEPARTVDLLGSAIAEQRPNAQQHPSNAAVFPGAMTTHSDSATRR